MKYWFGAQKWSVLPPTSQAGALGGSVAHSRSPTLLAQHEALSGHRGCLVQNSERLSADSDIQGVHSSLGSAHFVPLCVSKKLNLAWCTSLCCHRNELLGDQHNNLGLAPGRCNFLSQSSSSIHLKHRKALCSLHRPVSCSYPFLTIKKTVLLLFFPLLSKKQIDEDWIINLGW